MGYKKYQQKEWLTRLRREFDFRYAYGYEAKDQDDVFASIIEKVIVRKLPHVNLTDKQNPDGYVLGMFRYQAIDCFRHFHKRHTPPADLRHLGEPYPQIFYEYCLGGFSIEDIATRLKIALRDVTTWVAWLREEQKCPTTLRTVSLFDISASGDIADIPEYDSVQHLSGVEKAFTDTSRAVLAHWILGDLEPGTLDKGKEFDASSWLKRLAELPPPPIEADDVLLLKLIYFEELKLEKVGAVFGMAEYQVAHRRDRIFKKLAAFFRWHKVEFDV